MPHWVILTWLCGTYFDQNLVKDVAYALFHYADFLLMILLNDIHRRCLNLCGFTKDNMAATECQSKSGAKLTGLLCLIDSMQIKHIKARELQLSWRYCFIFTKLSSSPKIKNLKHIKMNKKFITTAKKDIYQIL